MEGQPTSTFQNDVVSEAYDMDLFRFFFNFLFCIYSETSNASIDMVAQEIFLCFLKALQHFL